MKLVLAILVVRLVFVWLGEKEQSNKEYKSDEQQDIKDPAAYQLR
jgi:hypothetical protein